MTRIREVEFVVSLSTLLQNIASAEQGPKTCAIFDFDGTIISGYSATAFLKDQIARGEISPADLVQLTQAATRFGLGSLGFSALMTVHAQYLAGRSESEYIANSERLFRRAIAKLIYPEARQLIEAHRAAGHSIAIISSATPYQVMPAAKDLEIEDVYATDLEVVDGQFTGGVIKPTCFGVGKVDAAERFAEKRDSSLENCFFYSDSTDDIELLEAASRPVVLNGSRELRLIARDKGWSIADFSSRGNTSTSQVVRSLAATGSLVGSFMMGLPLYALSGSSRDSVNFSISLFADTASALIGLDLDVRGREHLWKRRPAIFMFNHQSNADMLIMASLVRRDIVGVGKRELKNLPVIGPLMGASGVVFIDRSDRKAAIETMKPLVHAMQEEGKSLVIAPEGTRAPTRKLGAFKKGGFHVAIQSGIPIVPVVIHNSGDISPKGDRIFRSGTVQVDVLPALDTTSWSIQTIDEHVAAVRNLFLHTLGQPELTVAETTALRRDTPDDLKPEVRGQRKKASQPQSTAESSENSVNLRGRARGRRANAKRAPSTTPQNGVDHEAPATRH
ncbi:MAG: HAD-IB family hydrolase [Luminiphilus sp.]|nr:HAD-IB family hydrolase [Luminiphilus sp.]MDG2036583.1 HAD-IB family hydrolase [Luminiphilus sp.]